MEAQTDFDWNGDQRSSGFVHPEPSRGFRILLGALTLWPVLYVFLFVLGIAMIMALSAISEGAEPPFPAFAVIGVLHTGTILLSLAMTAYYTVYILRDARFTSDRRLLWVIVVVLGGMIGQAIFYVMWFWRHDSSVLGTAVRPPSPQVLPMDNSSAV